MRNRKRKSSLAIRMISLLCEFHSRHVNWFCMNTYHSLSCKTRASWIILTLVPCGYHRNTLVVYAFDMRGPKSSITSALDRHHEGYRYSEGN